MFLISFECIWSFGTFISINKICDLMLVSFQMYGHNGNYAQLWGKDKNWVFLHHILKKIKVFSFYLLSFVTFSNQVTGFEAFIGVCTCE